MTEPACQNACCEAAISCARHASRCRTGFSPALPDDFIGIVDPEKGCCSHYEFDQPRVHLLSADMLGRLGLALRVVSVLLADRAARRRRAA